MFELRKQYLVTLNEYINGKTDDLHRKLVALNALIKNISNEELMGIHFEMTQSLIRTANSEDTIRLIQQSTFFLTELMCVHNRNDNNSLALTINKLREMLAISHGMFHNQTNYPEVIIENMNIGTAIFDREGFISFINVKMGEILKLPRKELLGCDLPHLLTHKKISPSIRRLIYNTYLQIRERQKVVSEFNDSEGHTYLITVTEMDELDGGYLISAKDVTEIRQIEQSVYQNDKLVMLGKIAAAIAHEIRNPLTSIRGFVQLLLPILRELNKVDYGQIILDEIDRANEIIYEFLNSSKPSAPVTKKIAIESLVNEVSLLSQSEANLRNAQIRIEAMDPFLMVSIDVKQIKQVLLNVIRNAIEASEQIADHHGIVKVSLKRWSYYVMITVEDNGRGMTPETLSRLFEPFFTTKDEGTGLGLALCYRIIKNHGGYIDVDTEINVGTKFQILLPLAEEKEDWLGGN